MGGGGGHTGKHPAPGAAGLKDGWRAPSQWLLQVKVRFAGTGKFRNHIPSVPCAMLQQCSSCGLYVSLIFLKVMSGVYLIRHYDFGFSFRFLYSLMCMCEMQSIFNEQIL